MVIARSLRGMNDLFCEELAAWHQIEKSVASIFLAFGYQEIRTPILEELALFKRGIGENSDIVEKEMFLVEDGDMTYCLRPENTAPVVRALIERGVNEDSQEKLYYLGPMFRKERPQKGRLRQFHQLGVELFGVSEPLADVEIIVMMDQLWQTLGLSNITLKLNSLGTADERQAYKTHLLRFLESCQDKLCTDCQRRMHTNPLRVLDCKNKGCKLLAEQAPKIMDVLGPDSRDHFEQVLEGLGRQKVSYTIDHHLVRGLDYYNKTVFEFVADIGLGAQNAVAAGGRYDGLFLTLGNKIDLPAIGCAAGIERIALLMKQEDIKKGPQIQITLISADDQGARLSSDLAFSLRKMGIAADFSLTAKSIKAQMRRADRLGAQFIAVLGENEANNKSLVIKSLENKMSTELKVDAQAIANFLNSQFK